MKTHIPNSLGKRCLIISLSVSCILFQFMFFGLIHLYTGNPIWLMPGFAHDHDARHATSYFTEAVREALSAIDIICLLNMPVIMAHLALICYIALRQPRAAAAPMEFRGEREEGDCVPEPVASEI